MLLTLALLVIPIGLAFASDATEGVAILSIGPIFGIFAGMNQASEGHVLTVTGTFRGCLKRRTRVSVRPSPEGEGLCVD